VAGRPRASRARADHWIASRTTTPAGCKSAPATDWRNRTTPASLGRYIRAVARAAATVAAFVLRLVEPLVDAPDELGAESDSPSWLEATPREIGPGRLGWAIT
jgi:hypothetical protein